MTATATATEPVLNLETSPDQYRHWSLSFNGDVATLEMKVEALRNEVDGFVVERRKESAGIIDDDDEATAFDAFFEAEVVEDKARAWMLE